LFRVETGGVFLLRFLFTPRRSFATRFRRFLARKRVFSRRRALTNVLPNAFFLRNLRSLRRFDGGAQ
jgi:hypothetical protein